MAPFVFTKDTADDLPPKAIAVMFAVHPAHAMDMVMSLARSPFMAEAALRAFEANVFDLNAVEANQFRHALESQKSEGLLNRFDAVRDRIFLSTGRGSFERALSAIRTHNHIFLGRSLSGIDNLNDLVDRKSLPIGTRLATKVFDGADKAKTIFMSKGSALLLASSMSEYDLTLEGQEVINAGLHFKGVAVRLEGRNLGLAEYNHADLILRTPRPLELIAAVRRTGMPEEEIRDMFGKSLDRLIESKATQARSSAAGCCALNDLDDLSRLIIDLMKSGIQPSQKALGTNLKVQWTPEFRGSRHETFEGPFFLCLPTRGFGIKPKPTAPAVPTSLWTIIASNGLNEALEVAAQSGADLGASNPFNGFTALHGAAKISNIQTIDLLLRLGCDEKTKDIFGHTPRQWWQDRTTKPINEFDAAVQVNQARRAMDGILASVGQKKSP
jgi:hypothetical protein